MKVFDHIHQIKRTGNFGGWIRRIMVNECLRYLEKEKNIYNEIGLDNIFSAPVQDQLKDKFAVEDLMKMINSLPNGYRNIFNLYVIEGISHHEIARGCKSVKIRRNPK